MLEGVEVVVRGFIMLVKVEIIYAHALTLNIAD